MTLDQLRIFVAVAERQHVTRAAEALNLAQSAVSAAVAALEGRHGTKLFHRVGRGVTLTEIGLQFLPEARAVLARAAGAAALLDGFGELDRGSLSIHASQTSGSYWLPRYLLAFRTSYPKIALTLNIGNTAHVAAAVRDGSADLGVVEGVVEDPNLVSREVGRDQMVLVVGAAHPWVGRSNIVASELSTSKWILREPGSGTRSVFEAELKRLGLAGQLNILLELPSNEAVRTAVEAGTAATVISASVAAPSLEAGLLYRVKFPLPDRAFELLLHPQRIVSRATGAMIAMMGLEKPGSFEGRHTA